MKKIAAIPHGRNHPSRVLARALGITGDDVFTLALGVLRAGAPFKVIQNQDPASLRRWYFRAPVVDMLLVLKLWVKVARDAQRERERLEPRAEIIDFAGWCKRERRRLRANGRLEDLSNEKERRRADALGEVIIAAERSAHGEGITIESYGPEAAKRYLAWHAEYPRPLPDVVDLAARRELQENR